MNRVYCVGFAFRTGGCLLSMSGLVYVALCRKEQSAHYSPVSGGLFHGVVATRCQPIHI